jgi:hypothetical protein
MTKLDKWKPINTEKNLSKVAGEVARPKKKERLRLPHDIDYYVFSKVRSNATLSWWSENCLIWAKAKR